MDAVEIKRDAREQCEKWIAEAVAKERERCAKIAEAHKGSYAKKPLYAKLLQRASEEMLASTRDEERGEDIAAELIARAIRAQA